MDENILSSGESQIWYDCVTQSEIIKKLFNKSDIEESINQLNKDRVVQNNDNKVTVYFTYNKDESDSIYVSAEFNYNTRELIRAEINDSYISGPLAGHGIRWTYDDGEFTRNEWIS